MTQFKPIILAKEVRSIMNGDGEIEEYVNEILGMLNDEIKDAIEKCHDNVTLSLRTLFDVPKMKNADVQLSVYYWISTTLEKAGYKVRFMFQGNKSETQKVFITIRWFKKQDTDMKKYMSDHIKSHTIVKKPLPVNKKKKRND
jgi:hypothetical protein